MNSKLLEEAIIDAEALRNAALKSAESAILEKYAPEVKTAIETLLEQEEVADMAMDPSMDMSAGEAPAEEPELDVPPAATNGLELCPCPDDDEVIRIKIGDLENTIKKTIADASRASAEEPPAEEMPQDLEMDTTAEEEIPGDEVSAEEAPLEDEPVELQEDFEISEELIASILSEEEHEQEEEQEEKQEEEQEGEEKKVMEENRVLHTQNSELLVEQNKTIKQNKLLTEKLEKLLEQQKELLEENKKVKQAALQVSESLEKTNIMNAKLFYKNQALSSDSLNERQKNKIVEAISQADSVDEAKMIYDTLSNAVGSFDKKAPQSLSEAVEKKGGLVFKPRQEEKNSNSNPVYTKWQKIAGIKK